MKKLLWAVLGMALVVSCGKTEDAPSLGDLVVAFSSDSFTCNPGENISLPFTVANIQGAELALSASSSSAEAKVSVSADANWQGSVEFTAPSFSDGTPITVTLYVSDPAGGRRTSAETLVNVSESDPLVVSLASVISSMTVKPSGSFSLPVRISGANGKVTGTVSGVTSGWSASFEAAADNAGGDIRVTAPSSLTSSLSLSLRVEDEKKRSADLDLNLTIVAATTTANAANCHVVSPGSTLTISAVEGNSTTAVDFNGAALVWQDANGLVKSVSGNGDEHIIVVELAPGKTGNAVVAAVKDTTIVWSWHVWVTSEDPTANAMTWKGEKGSYVFMDRNLGASSAEKYSAGALGLLYQWGRKDPFTGADGVLSSAYVKTYDMDGNQVWLEDETRPTYGDHKTTNLSLSIEHPDVFYVAPSSAWPVVDWLTDEAALQDNDLWGAVSGVKTKYDPCPYGWKVPGAGDPWGFRKLYKKAGSLTDAGLYDSSYPWYIDPDDAHSLGFRYKPAGSDSEWWFPFAGHKNPNNGALESVGGGANYNTANVTSSMCMMEMLAWGNPASESGLNRPYGSSVRCIKE